MVIWRSGLQKCKGNLFFFVESHGTSNNLQLGFENFKFCFWDYPKCHIRGPALIHVLMNDDVGRGRFSVRLQPHRQLPTQHFLLWFICLNESTTHGGLFLSFPPSPLLLAPPFKQISISHGDFTYICLYYIDAFVRLWLFRELSLGESGDHYPSICLLISQRLKA